MRNKILDDINLISSFLAVKDLNCITETSLMEGYNISNVDLLILLGNAIPFIAEEAARIYCENLTDKILISGGIGHSTQYLIQNIKLNNKYNYIAAEDRPEADILKDVLIYNGVDGEDIFIENVSTNCGSNAIESLKLIKKTNFHPKNIILMQDPTMQLRSCASFKHIWKELSQINFINFSAFIPILDINGDSFIFKNKIEYLWSIERFLSLLMGEIPRLKDDENGYGPNGKNYICHIDLPENIEPAFNNLSLFLKDNLKKRVLI